jgi:hypothetical protein
MVLVLFIILGVVVLITIVVLGVLFFMLGKEGQKKEEEKIVPLTDLEQLKKELSSGLLEPQKPAVDDTGIVPLYESKVSLPMQEVRSPLEDETYKKRAKELEDELWAISHKATTQSDEAKQLIETLTKENEALKIQQANLEQAQQKLVELQGEASSLKIENVIQMGEEIAKANATVIELNREKEALLSAPHPEADGGLRQELEALKNEQIQLRQKYEDLDRTHQKLRELNTHLMEKNDLLQYEMIKARAQSSGLERVSFNYKNQLEDFLKKVNAAQVTNEQLSQVKNRLEDTVTQVKLQNEELVKKDQLAQFELEKNHSRLANLEREYEDLKARTQKDSP